MKHDNRIIIVEPSPVLRAGLAQFLSDCNQISVVSQLENLDRLEEKLLSIRPDILIVNSLLVSHESGRAFANLCHEFPEMIPVAFQTAYTPPECLQQFKEVLGLYDSKQKMMSTMLNLLNEGAQQNSQGDSPDLSNREQEVLMALVKGKSNKEIADELYLSIHTVISHRKNIIKKTGIKSVSGLTVFALLNNLVDESEILPEL